MILRVIYEEDFVTSRASNISAWTLFRNITQISLTYTMDRETAVACIIMEPNTTGNVRFTQTPLL